jgi:hypothetical protein
MEWVPHVVFAAITSSVSCHINIGVYISITLHTFIPGYYHKVSARVKLI